MKKLLFLLAAGFCLLCTDIKAQLTTEIIQPEPQSGQYNYFGVRLHLEQALDRDLVVSGSIYDDGSPSNSVPFTLTIYSGTQTAETANNILQACPACGAGVILGTLTATYANVSVIFDVQAGMLKFNSITDVSTVLNQLDADYETYNTNYESQYPNLTPEQLDDIDEQNNFDQFKPFKDFEGLFSGFYSKRAEVENIEIAWLVNNFTGADPDDTDLTFDDALNTIFNGSNSFKIGNSVYQLTANGMYIDGVLNEDVGTIALKSFDLKPNSLYKDDYPFFFPETLRGGPSFNFTPLEYENAPTPCKSNKRNDTAATFDNNTKRAKYKVSITSIAIRSGVGGKVVYYKRKNNGGWKNARTEMAVSCAGTIYNGNCATSFQFSDRNPINGSKKRNRISTRRHTPAAIPSNDTIWKTYSGQIGMSFEFSGLATGNLLLTF